ncbi:hypothetical protein FB639_004040, partial [Coemansia asiatica]
MFSKQDKHNNTSNLGSVGGNNNSSDSVGNVSDGRLVDYHDYPGPPPLSFAKGDRYLQADLREERPLSIQSLLNGRASLSPPPVQSKSQPKSQLMHVSSAAEMSQQPPETHRTPLQLQIPGPEKIVCGTDPLSPPHSNPYQGYLPQQNHPHHNRHQQQQQQHNIHNHHQQQQQQQHLYQSARSSVRSYFAELHYPHSANSQSLVFRNGTGSQGHPMASTASSLGVRYRPYPEIHSVGPQPPPMGGALPQTANQQMQQLQQLAHRANEDTIGKLPLYARISAGGISRDEKRTARRAGHSDQQISQQQQQQNLQLQQQRRRRRTQACEYCHLKKIKCEGDGVRCINCIKNDVQCTWGLKRKRGPKPKVSIMTEVASAALGRAKSLQRQKHQQQQQHQPQQENMSLVQKPDDKQPLGQNVSARRPEQQTAGHSSAAISVSTTVTATTTIAKAVAVPSTSQVPIAMILRNESASPSQSPAHISADDIQSDDESAALSPPSSDTFEGLRAPAMDGVLSEFFSEKFDADTRDTVRYYFDYFYPLCPMFHPSMFIRRVVRGEVDPLLLDAMRAASARVITRMTGRAVDGPAIAKSVKQRIILQLEQPSVDLVRVLVIMTLLSGSQGEYMSYNSLICLAASIVVRMGWHKLDLYKRPPPASWEDWVQLEVKRRVFWLVYQTDSYQAMLTGRPMSIDEDTVYVQAPCSDYEWDVIMHSPENAASPMDKLSSSSATTALAAAGPIDQSKIVATGAFSYSFMAL